MDNIQQVEMTEEEEREYWEDRMHEVFVPQKLSEEELKKILEEKKKHNEKYKEIYEAQSAEKVWARVRERKRRQRHQQYDMMTSQ